MKLETFFLNMACSYNEIIFMLVCGMVLCQVNQLSVLIGPVDEKSHWHSFPSLQFLSSEI
jgi:hypothetical protein